MFRNLPGITEVPNRKKERKKESSWGPKYVLGLQIRVVARLVGGGSTRSPVTLSQPVLVPWWPTVAGDRRADGRPWLLSSVWHFLRWVFGVVLFFFFFSSWAAAALVLWISWFLPCQFLAFLSCNVSPQHPMVFSFSLGIRRAIDEALVRRFACLRAEIGSDGEGKGRGLQLFCARFVWYGFVVVVVFFLGGSFFLWDVLCRTWRKTCVFFSVLYLEKPSVTAVRFFFLLSVCEEDDYLASGGEERERGFLLLPQGRKASQWRDCDDFTRRQLL